MADSEQTPNAATGLGAKILIVTALALAVAAVFYAKGHTPDSARGAGAAEKSGAAGNAIAGTAPLETTAAPTAETKTPPTAALPRLVDLGAGKCIPCKMMAPILDDLKKEYAGTLDVQFVDVWENPDAAKKYDIELIPTQIFYDASGKERFRHQGFFAKEDIIAKWKELGVDLSPAPGVR